MSDSSYALLQAQHPYIRRRGRTTKSQAHALDALIAPFRALPEDIVQADDSRAVGIEIGFGMGHAFFDWASSSQDWRLFGIELHQPGIGALVHRLHQAQLTQVKILELPAQSVFAAIADESIDEIRIFFPDPWPKKRHFKRRLIQPEFVSVLARTLKKGGILRIATDWLAYADWIRQCLAAESRLLCHMDNIRAASAPGVDGVRELTNFEKRGERLGHDIHDMVYVRDDAADGHDRDSSD